MSLSQFLRSNRYEPEGIRLFLVRAIKNSTRSEQLFFLRETQLGPYLSARDACAALSMSPTDYCLWIASSQPINVISTHLRSSPASLAGVSSIYSAEHGGNAVLSTWNFRGCVTASLARVCIPPEWHPALSCICPCLSCRRKGTPLCDIRLPRY